MRRICVEQNMNLFRCYMKIIINEIELIYLYTELWFFSRKILLLFNEYRGSLLQ